MQKTGGTWRTPKGTEVVARTGSWLLSADTENAVDVDQLALDLDIDSHSDEGEIENTPSWSPHP